MVKSAGDCNCLAGLSKQSLNARLVAHLTSLELQFASRCSRFWLADPTVTMRSEASVILHADLLNFQHSLESTNTNSLAALSHWLAACLLVDDSPRGSDHAPLSIPD